MIRQVRSFFAMASAAALCPFAAVAANTWYVSPDGDDSAAGTREAPWRTIQYAVNASAAVVAGDTVVLLPGDHVEGSTTVNSMTSRANVVKQLTIKSLGREYRDSTRIVGAHDESATSTGGLGDNAVRGLRIATAASGTRIEGITFYKGSTAYNGNSGADKSEGGGIYVANGTEVVIVDCAFVDCQATRGGGIYYDNAKASDVKAVRCLFKRCRDTKFGAAIRGCAAYDCVFDDCGQVRSAAGSAVGETANAKDAMAYCHSAINCTFVNNEGYGVSMAAETSGGVYNCLFMNNGEGAVKSEKSALVGGNLKGGNIYANAQLYSPLDGDYRLIPSSTAIGAADAANRAPIPAEYRSADYAGGAVAASGTINAGAVQTVADADPAGVAFTRYAVSKWFPGDLEYDGEPVEVFFRTWRAVPGWPSPRHIKYTPESGRHLVRYYINNGPVWPLRDGSVWINSSRAGQVQTLGLVIAADAYWADPENGSDATGDGSEENPYQTLAKAVQASTATHVVYAKRGDYNSGAQTVCGRLSRIAVQSNFAGEMRVIAVDGPENTFISGTNGTDNATYNTGTTAVRCIGVAATNAYYVAFQGFTLRDGHTDASDANGTAATMGGALANFNGSAVAQKTAYLLDCIVDGCSAPRGGAINGGNAIRCVFKNCQVQNSGGGGLLRNCTVVSSLVTGCSGASEIVAAGAEVYNCTFWANSTASLYLSGGNIYNSILAGRTGGSTHDIGYPGSAFAAASVKNTLYGRNDAGKVVNFDDTVKAENPVLFLDSDQGDCRLSADSLGYSLASTAYMKSCMDIDGNPFRIDAETGTYTVGCYDATIEGGAYYVDPENGSDANDGSESAPYATLAAALAAARYGDTVIALPGTYATGTAVPTLAQAGGSVTPTVAARVVVKSGVTLQSRDGAAETVIRGAADPTTGGCGDGAVRGAFVCKGATLRGFTVTGGYTGPAPASMTVNDIGGGVCGWYAGTTGTADDFAELVEDCIIDGNTAIRGGGAMFGWYRNCVFTGNSLPSSAPGYALARAKAEGCLFHGNGQPGGHSAIYGVELVNCTVLGGQAGVANSGVVNNENGAYRNRPVLNSVVLGEKAKFRVATNCVVSSTTAISTDANYELQTSNVFAGDSSLGADGAPLSGSGAIDAGDASLCSAESLAGRDVAGTRRVLDSAIDIGAFEYDWGVPWGNALGGKRLAIDDMPSDAALVGGALVFGAPAIGEAGVPVTMTWTGNGNGAAYDFSALVSGAGTLTVTANGAVLATLTAADCAGGTAPKALSFSSALAANSLVFSYDGADARAVTLSTFRNQAPFVLVFR